jgi:membrane protease YdiL (CAAX protease family)
VANEPIAVGGKKKDLPDLLKPAIIATIALIAVLVVSLFFRSAVIAIMYPFRDTLLSWTTNYDSNPFLNAVYQPLYGLMLLLLAGLLILGKNLPDVLSDRQWLRMDSADKDHFVVSLILGIIIFTVATLTITIVHIYQSYQYPVSFQPEELAVTLIMLVPVLLLSAGKVALIQGFFQRILAEKYGAIAGIIAAAFIFMILELFPKDIPQLWSLAFWQINSVFFLTGTVVAYLFYRTKSFYAPIGFLFAWNITYYLLNTIQLETWSNYFTPITLVGNYPVPILYDLPVTHSMYITVGYGMKILLLLITLVMLGYFRNKTLEDLKQLKDRVKNASRSILSNLARE